VQKPGRNRALWIGLITVVIGCGLGTRSPTLPFSRSATGYAGDALWALAVFLGYGFLFPRRRTITIVVLAAGTSLLVELCQLYHAQWIDSIRGTTLGHLVLGSGFDPIDLICYGAGIVVGALVEAGLFRMAQRRATA
jgi:hypothetical protein